MSQFASYMQEALWKILPTDKALLKACEDAEELDRVKDLIENNNANVNAKDDRHRTPLHQASWRDCHKTVAYLLLVGAEPNHQDVNGRTPLMLACRHGGVESVRHLCKHGANKTLKDEWDRIAGEIFDGRITAETQDIIRRILAGEDDGLKRHIAAKHMQRIFRGHWARNTVKPHMEEMRLQREADEREAAALREEWAREMGALAIQSAFRCHLARKRMIKKWVELNAPPPVVQKNEKLQAGILYGDDKRSYEPAEIEIPGGAALLFVRISGHFTAFEVAHSPLHPKGQKSHTEYHVQVRCDAATPHQTWRVCRRYHDFDDLHKELRKKGFALPDLPRKKLFGQMEHEFVIQRQGHLEKWLEKVIENSRKFEQYTNKNCQVEQAFRLFMTKNPETVVEEEEEVKTLDKSFHLLDIFTSTGEGADEDAESHLKYSKLAIERPLSYNYGGKYVRSLCRDLNVDLKDAAVDHDRASLERIANRQPSQKIGLPEKNSTGSTSSPSRSESPKRATRGFSFSLSNQKQAESPKRKYPQTTKNEKTGGRF